MNPLTATEREIHIVNTFLLRERPEFEFARAAKRYARRPGISDKLVQFEAGATAKLVNLDNLESDTFYLTFHEPINDLWLKINYSDFLNIMDDANQLLSSIMIYAIRKAGGKIEPGEYDGDDTFGAF